jgi:glutaminase
VVSPRLDERGNTVRGIAVARELADRFDLHLMHHSGRTAPVVYLEATEPAEDGRPIAILAAQGELEFAAAERLVWAIGDALGDDPLQLAGLLLDLHRVTRVHHIAERMLDVSLSALVEQGLPVAIVQQDGIAASIGASVRFGSREEAQAWCYGGAAPA